MNSYVVSGPGVQLSAVFRVPHTAGGANFDVSSHLMAWAQTSGEAEEVQPPGVESAAPARPAGQRGEGLPLGPPPRPHSRKLELSREHFLEVRAVPSAGSWGVCP